MKIVISTRLPLVVGVWITGAVTLLGLGTAVLRPQLVANNKVSAAPPTAIQLALAPNCQTVATDPQPPLNIRTAPIATTSQNIIGTVNNGTVLAVVAAQPEWLKISQPVAGWVHQPLTATHCANAQGQAAAPGTTAATTAAALPQPSRQVIDSAHDRFEAGQLQAALSLLQSVPQTDATYPQAQAAYQTMSAQWHQGHVAYQSARRAIAQGHWQGALNTVQQVPDVRYWHEQMAPLVKQAIVNQNAID
jgi:Bacterial SH3 domain